LVGYGKKAFHKPPQALARKRYTQPIGDSANFEHSAINEQLQPQ